MQRQDLRPGVVLAAIGLVFALAGLCGCAFEPVGHMAAFAVPEARVEGMPPALSALAETAAGEVAALDPGLRERLVIYNATVELSVDHIAYSLDAIKSLAGKLGGYVQQMSTTSATIRVPAAKFHEAIAAIEKLGKVRDKQVVGSDVTERVRDWRIRLDNAQKLRERLVGLLAKAQKVEEMLKVEKELGRVTETVELLKGKLRQLEHRVAYSTITARLTSELPQEQFDTKIPFAWVTQLGVDLVRGETGRPYPQRSKWARVAVDMPKGYVKYCEWNYLTRALSADGVVIQVRRLSNYRGGSVAFWHALVRRVLVDEKHFKVGEEPTLRLRGGFVGRALVTTKQIGGTQHGYLIVVATTRHYVYVFEAWGPQDQLASGRAAILDSAKSMRLGFWDALLWYLF